MARSLPGGEIALPSALVGRSEPRVWAQLPALLLVGFSLAVVGIQSWLSLEMAGDADFLGARAARWAIVTYALIAAATAGIALVAPMRSLWLALVPGSLALVASLTAVAFAGLEIWPLAAAGFTLSGAWLVGRQLLAARWLHAQGVHESGITALAVGLGVLSLAVLTLGRAGLLHWWTIGLATIGLGVVGAIRLTLGRSPGACLESVTRTRLRAATFGIVALQGAFAVIWAGAPEVQFDALWYKGWLPELWAQTGRIDGQTFTDHPYISIAGLMQHIAVPGHTVGAPGVGRYLELIAWIVILATVWRVGDRIGKAVGPLAALVVALAPLAVWSASTAYEELGLTLLVLGTASAIAHYGERQLTSPFRVSLVVGFLAGACITGKLHLVPFALAAGLGWLVVSRSGGDLGRRLSGFALGIAVAAVPLLLFRWLETGNPVMPYFNNIFESPHFLTGGLTSFAEGGGESLGQRGGDHWAPRWVRLPWILVYNSSPFTEVAAPGVLGLLVPALVIAVAFGWRARTSARVVWGAVVLGLAGWWIQLQYLRFILPLAILGVVVAVPALGGLDRLLQRRLAASAAVVTLAVAATAFFVSSAASFWNVPDRVPLSVAVGREPEDAYEHRALLDAAASEYLNEHAEPGAKILGQGYARTLLRNDLELTADWEFGDLLRVRDRFTGDPDALEAALEAQGFSWMVVGGQGRLLDIDEDFIALLVPKYGQIVFADHLRDVYRLVDRPAPTLPVALCDEDFTRPECWIASVPPDRSPGLTDVEVRSGPVAETSPACPGATYALSVSTGPGRDFALVFFTFDLPDPEQGFRYLVVPPGDTAVFHQTAPADAETLTIVVDTLGPTASVRRLSLAIADTSLRGSPCP